MRLRALLASTAALLLGLAAPAVAGDTAVQAFDYAFGPRSLQIEPGDSVTWTFSGTAEHTATSEKRQAERWSSGLRGAGETYSHTFTKPGRYQYICLPHRFSMKGTVIVGSDPFARSFGAVLTSGSRSRLRLREAARVTATLTSPKRRRVFHARLDPGRVVVRWGKGLAAGSYKGTITAVDDFDAKTVRTVRFAIAG